MSDGLTAGRTAEIVDAFNGWYYVYVYEAGEYKGLRHCVDLDTAWFIVDQWNAKGKLL